MTIKNFVRNLKKLFLFYLILHNDCMYAAKSINEQVGLGVIFDQNIEEVQNAFKMGVMHHTNQSGSRPNRLEFQAYVDIINTADVFKLSRLICNQFSRGVWSMLAAVTPESFDTLHSYTNTFQMPFVTAWFPEKVKLPTSGFLDYALSLRPDYHRAVIDVVTFYGWKNVIFIYDSHDDHVGVTNVVYQLKDCRAYHQCSVVYFLSWAEKIQPPAAFLDNKIYDLDAAE